MRFDSRNLLIVVMFLIIIALMGLIYRTNKLVVDHVPDRIEPEVYVMGLTEDIEKQNQAYARLSYTAGWYKAQLANCLSLIESERGLEPIPIQYPKDAGPLPPQGYQIRPKGPFVVPYKVPQYDPPKQSDEKNLRHLNALVNLSSLTTNTTMFNMENEIENFRQRLERISPDPNDPYYRNQEQTPFK